LELCAGGVHDHEPRRVMARAIEPQHAHEPAAITPTREPRGGRWPTPLLLLYLVAVAVYVPLALSVPLPILVPDEQRYSQLARSLVAGHGFVWRGAGHGQAIDQTAALYVYFIAPVWWLFDSAVHARDASKVLGTLVLCSQVLPVWCLARRVIGPWLALVPATLAIAGTSMLISAMTITEVLALPLSTAALCCTAMALQRPGSRIGYAAILFAGLAAWARIQLVVLMPVVLLALALDVLRCPGDRQQRLRAHRPFLVITGALCVGMVVASQIAPAAAGDYVSVLETSAPPAGLILRKTGLQLLELVVLSGFVPVLLATVVGLSRRAWRDDRTGPLLIVFWLAALSTAIQSGLYLAANPHLPSGIERYVMYSVPIALVLTAVVLDRPQMLPRGAFAVAGLIPLLLVVMPAHQLVVIEAAVSSTASRAGELTGLQRPGSLAVAGVAAIFATWAACRRRSGRAAVLGGGAVLLTVLAIQDQAMWHQTISSWKEVRAVVPRDLQWVDHHAGGPVGVLSSLANAPQVAYVEYYNTSTVQAFVPQGTLPTGPPVQGKSCTYAIGAGGALAFAPGCGPVPHLLLLPDWMVRLRFYRETGSVREPLIGRIVQLDPHHRPRLRSRLTLPCEAPMLPMFSKQDDARTLPASTPRPCLPSVQLDFWLDEPATVSIWFRGSAGKHHATVGVTDYTLPANRVTRIEGDVPRGDSQYLLNLDWATSTGPRIIKAQMRTGGRTISLIY
jgi:hypothetical protein